MKPLDPDDTRPPYQQMAEAIREAIIAGEYPPGAALPSRSSLAHMFGVAPMTVQSAIRDLKDDGVVVTRQGSGVYVRQVPDTPRDPLAEIDELRAMVEELRDRVDQLSGHTNASPRD